MSEKVHPWCSDTARDEAIRAAEDAAAAERTPLPDHRDLPSAVAELRERVARLEAVAQPRPEPTTGSESVTQARRVGNWRWFDKSSAPPPPPPPAPPQPAPVPPSDGLRTERVTLEITHGSVVGAAGWSWGTIISVKPGESVRVVDVGELSCSLDAAIKGMERAQRERDDAISEYHSVAAERDAAIRDLDGAMRGNTRLTNDVAALKARVAELENATAPAANAGGEANQPWPMAFAVWGRGAVCGVTVSREDAGAMQREFAFDTEVMPLYAAPQPPRRWLTEEDCAALYLACAVLDGVFVGSWQEKHDAARRLVSIRERARREAGGEVG